MRVLASLVAGLVFGVGLVVSGMSDPAKVLNFLDLAGHWDPSLAFVMAGAVAVTFLGYRVVLQRERPLLAPQFHLPAARGIDTPLVAGAALFGLGWGLGGFCPGPAVTAISLAAPGTLVFVPAMLLGMWGARVMRSRGAALAR
jgi:uncharacterized membrane protein YedE/YeeE